MVTKKKTATLKPDGDYTLKGGSIWITVGPVAVNIHKTDEGVVCDMYPADSKKEDLLATCYAFDNDALPEED